MELIEERGANPIREGATPHNGNTPITSITGAKLLNGVKRTNSNEDILQYSKIIDENGEPMVVCMKLFSECIKCSLQNFVPYQAVIEVSGSSGHKSSS